MLRRTVRVFSAARINTMQQVDKDKVVDRVKLADVQARADESGGGKVFFCRCWKSKTFPYCDGAHNAHNDETGDNIGPLVISK